jgi:transcriptional regulator with XRE-family HTH domain
MVTTAHGRPLREADAQFLHRLGHQIRQERHDRKLSQQQLAGMAGVSRNFVSLVERGCTGFDVVRLIRVAEALGMQPASLLAAAQLPARLGHGRSTGPHPVKAVAVGPDQITRAGLP